jgi:predicted DNA-binding transcriptional regulator AlpA
MTAAQVARKIGVSRQSLYNWLKHGHLVGPAKLGRNRRPGAWTMADLERARVARKTIPGPGGCKPRKVLDARLIARLRAQGGTWAKIAERVGCCVPVARAALRATKAATDPELS